MDLKGNQRKIQTKLNIKYQHLTPEDVKITKKNFQRKYNKLTDEKAFTQTILGCTLC